MEKEIYTSTTYLFICKEHFGRIRHINSNNGIIVIVVFCCSCLLLLLLFKS